VADSKPAVGLDIGTSKICAIVGQYLQGSKTPEIIGFGTAPSTGLRKGVVSDVEETVSNISAALEKAERVAGVPLSNVYLGINGSHISFLTSKGVIAVSRASGEIGDDDVSRAIEAAEAVSLPTNSEILHVIPHSYTVDNQSGITDPIGMSGVRLEAAVHIITGSTPIVKNFTKCVLRTGVDINELVLNPLASSRSSLTDRQKELGCVLIDIGAGTCGLAVYEEGSLLYATVLPIGSGHITNDIAIGLRTSIDVAEKVKLEYGFAKAKEISKHETIDLSSISQEEEGKVLRHHVAEIIEARLNEIFSMVRAELKKISKDVLLPAGAILVGGGAKLAGITDLAKEKLKLPCQVGFPLELKGIVDRVDDPAYTCGVGLMLWGLDSEAGKSHFGFLRQSQTLEKIKKWFKSFLP
jgi:cell division protein FtsA